MKCKNCGHRMNVKKKVWHRGLEKKEIFGDRQAELIRADFSRCGRCGAGMLKEYWCIQPSPQLVKMEFVCV